MMSIPARRAMADCYIYFSIADERVRAGLVDTITELVPVACCGGSLMRVTVAAGPSGMPGNVCHSLYLFLCRNALCGTDEVRVHYGAIGGDGAIWHVKRQGSLVAVVERGITDGAGLSLGARMGLIC